MKNPIKQRAMERFFLLDTVRHISSYHKPIFNKKDIKKPSELTEGEVDTSLLVAVTKGLGSSASEPWKLEVWGL